MPPGVLPSSPQYLFIIGAISAIGQAMSEIFARNLHGRAHIILVGRKRAAAERIIKSFPSPPSQAPNEDKTGAGTASPNRRYKYEFYQCDITLMANIHAMAKDLLARLPKINYLIHSAGLSGLLGRVDTSEGLDRKMTVRYYSRFAVVYDLLPLLKKAKELHEPAAVEFVFGSGMAPEIDLELALKKTYTGLKAMLQTVSYADVLIANLKSLRFMYILIQLVLWLLHPLFLLVTTSQEDSAEWMIFSLLDADKDLRRYNPKGDDIGMKGLPKAKDAGKLLREGYWRRITMRD